MADSAGSFTKLEYFRVEGLHKRQDIGIIMSGSVGIFIADNGSGKTTALYMLQCVLRGDFVKLTKFDYERIVVKFSGVDQFVLTPEDYEQSRSVTLLRRLNERTGLPPSQVLRLAAMAKHQPYHRLREDAAFMSAARSMRIPFSAFVDRLQKFDQFSSPDTDMLSLADNSPLVRLRQFLSESFCQSVLYLPTYRRIEQDLEELLDLDEDENEMTSDAIHFGMKDVNERIRSATNQIGVHFISSYGQISGQMLGQLAENTPLAEEMLGRLANRSSIELVLGRVGENVTDTQKSLILKLYDNGELSTNRHLSFFLSSLIEAYEQVQEVDRALQRYAKVCNGYLINKEMRYDILNATVAVYETIGNTKLDLDDLSSGEKQILGVMSELYLGDHDSYFVIFDEPELSLSMDWQKKILVDVAASHKTGSLVAVTHSPFVFENELDAFAKVLEVKFRSPTEGQR
ncbi:AAA family ATPase [Sphingosinicella sp. BN140058]|uniref:AAA family ATPase n=1 Tax=Sphingosinicella sp. BN140058 TaxID=1892855 RepID=UPI001010851A|nr:AAA family ATPase [Sphingosinicella sp. BN140058]QAY76132.1 hypothetical protein ETR14_06010 [Sphingosinicella sp. BN140058]